MKMTRIGVKMENTNRYQAVVQLDDGAIALAPSPNKIYHSYFPLESGRRLVKELLDAGIDAKLLDR
jgi:hypothetical protein